ncbi:hypothetical protein F5Y13DRAFT_190049 [Hypoxylon sp. FL1857]|nr:hypothetical protein F5Y13DRAFT_190049 [Hypoxylon sp. FL1857]
MDGLRDNAINQTRKATTPKGPSPLDNPHRDSRIDLLELAASRNTSIGHAVRFTPGTPVSSNSSYTPVLPAGLPVVKPPQPVRLRYQVMSGQASSRQNHQTFRPVNTTVPVNIDKSLQPRTPKGKIPVLRPSAPAIVPRLSRDHTRQMSYTMSHFELNRGEVAPLDRSIPQNDNKGKTPTLKPPPLPYSLEQVYTENRRMSAEAKRAEDEKARKIAQAKHIEAEMKANYRWPGDTSTYPAQVMEDFAVPNSELRAKAIHVGTPISENSPFIGVYAVRRMFSQKAEFRMAQDSSSPEEISQGNLVEFKNIRLNQYFQNMSESQIELWARHLLATVPGTNNTLMKWT